MKPGGGKRKGSQFERSLAKKLSLWWTDGERSDIFWLSSGSGARHTTRQKSNESTANSAGDLNVLDPIGQPLIDLFVIEAKCGYTKEIDVLAIIDSKKKNHVLFEWILKAEQEAAISDRKGAFLIFKRDRHQECIMMERDLFSKIILYCGNCPAEYLQIYTDYIILSLDDFLSWVDRDSIEVIAKDFKHDRSS